MKPFTFLCLLLIIQNVTSLRSIKPETCRRYMTVTSEYNAYPYEIIEDFRPIGYQQCVKKCQKYTDCADIFYNRNQLSCHLLRGYLPYYAPLNINGYGNSEIYNTNPCETCQAREVCIVLKSGENVCMEVPRTCHSGDVMFNNMCYYFSSHILTWMEAQVMCGYMYGVLVTIDTMAVNQMLVAANINDIFYTGGNDIAVNTEYVWAEYGQPFGFTNWYPGGPGNATTQNCVAINTNTGLWSDDSCFDLKRFICQYNLQSL